jgi:hypothetical protein
MTPNKENSGHHMRTEKNTEKHEGNIVKGGKENLARQDTNTSPRGYHNAVITSQ